MRLRPHARLVAVSVLLGSMAVMAPSLGQTAAPADAAVPRATCGDGSVPEPGLQGQVPAADRAAGGTDGYRCNLTLVGQWQGQGGSWVGASYGTCYYMPTAFPTDISQPGQLGVQVLDVRDPSRPELTTRLQTPAMLSPWESLKVHPGRGLLAAVAGYGSAGAGPVFFDVYDVSADCTKPRLLSSTPTQLPVGHEGNFSADGMTYYSSSTYSPTVTAIDVSNPALPRTLTTFQATTHGISTSADGTRLYLAEPKPADGLTNGFVVLDVTQIQKRTGVTTSTIGATRWEDGSLAQHTLPVTYNGRPYVYVVDEGGSGGGFINAQGPAGGVRLVDVADETAPKVVSKIKLEIQLHTNNATARAEASRNGTFGYQAHYCSVDRAADPRLLACGQFQSGIRVFDVRNGLQPREVAYFNPPAQQAKGADLNGSEHASRSGQALTRHLGQAGGATGQQADLSTDWCSSPTRFVPTRAGMQLWTHCQDNGFLALRLATSALTAPAQSPPAAATRPRASAPDSTSAAPQPAANSQLPATGAQGAVSIIAAVAVLSGLLAGARRRHQRATGRQ